MARSYYVKLQHQNYTKRRTKCNTYIYTYRNLPFNSLVWDSLTLTPLKVMFLLIIIWCILTLVAGKQKKPFQIALIMIAVTSWIITTICCVTGFVLVANPPDSSKWKSCFKFFSFLQSVCEVELKKLCSKIFLHGVHGVFMCMHLGWTRLVSFTKSHIQILGQSRDFWMVLAWASSTVLFACLWPLPQIINEFKCIGKRAKIWSC